MSNQNQFLLYTAPDGAVKVDVLFKDETVWLTQKTLAELFGVKRSAVTKRQRNIFSSGELEEDSVCSILEHTAGDGNTYSAKYYNLDAEAQPAIALLKERRTALISAAVTGQIDVRPVNKRQAV
jgi:hypothetical protein